MPPLTTPVTVDQIAGDPTLASDLPLSVLTDLIARCSIAKSVLIARLTALQTTPTRQLSSPSDELLTVGEVASILKFKQAYVYELARRGQISSIRSGKYVRFSRASLQAWQEKQQG